MNDSEVTVQELMQQLMEIPPHTKVKVAVTHKSKAVERGFKKLLYYRDFRQTRKPNLTLYIVTEDKNKPLHPDISRAARREDENEPAD